MEPKIRLVKAVEIAHRFSLGIPRVKRRNVLIPILISALILPAAAGAAAPEGAVVGKVVASENSEPVAGIKVTLYWYSGGSLGTSYTYSSVTDQDGAYVITAPVIHGETGSFVRKYSIYATDSVRINAWVPDLTLSSHPDSTVRRNLSLITPPAITGQVRMAYPSSDPIPNARVVLYRTSEFPQGELEPVATTWTNADGGYNFQKLAALPEGRSYRIMAEKAGYRYVSPYDNTVGGILLTLAKSKDFTNYTMVVDTNATALRQVRGGVPGSRPASWGMGMGKFFFGDGNAYDMLGRPSVDIQERGTGLGPGGPVSGD